MVSLIYDVEEALVVGKVATLVIEDVMGAFDAILRNRMVLYLRQQGWLDFLIRWIVSFLLDRLASVRFKTAMWPALGLSNLPNTVHLDYGCNLLPHGRSP